MAQQHGNRKVVKLCSEEDVAVALAKYTADRSREYIQEKGSFSVVLSGGSLIDTMRKLVEPPYLDTVDWSKWLIFWVDERCVPLGDKDSNYLLATQGFLSKVPIPPGNVYAINDKILTPEGVVSPQGSADDYEQQLRKLVENKTIPLSKSGFPKFDLMLLGMGHDGHVASLFPNRTQRYEEKRWVTFITDSPKPPPPRITFTFPVINAASEIAMVVTGAEVAPSVAKALAWVESTEPSSAPPPLPCALVHCEKDCTWFLDSDAASKMSPSGSWCTII